ncbi:MAG TPA: hypothetical protein PKC18_10980 [Lacipirellulaceae bacterium]|nr:hypothetical protein [Lacipirellulaceae bacterium]
MGIPVTCPHGHHFSVKDKYAGKKGLCPYCEGQVMVRVPDALSSQGMRQAVTRAVRDERKGPMPSLSDSSVLDGMPEENASPSSSGSFMSSSVVRHNVRCKCGESVPMWFAKCPKCGTFIEHF